jgi:Flp pilus assembly protein TadG
MPIRLPSLLRLKRLWRNQDGVSAVEFALIAPVMVLIYLGCIELSLMMRVDRRVTSTTAAIGDLTARLSTVSDADLSEIYQAARVMMQPYDVTDAKLRLTSVSDNSGNLQVDWSENANWTSLAPGSSVSIPTGIVPAGGSVIMAQVEYEYEGTFGFIIETERTITDTFYLRPRRVNQIPRDGTGTLGP